MNPSRPHARLSSGRRTDLRSIAGLFAWAVFAFSAGSSLASEPVDVVFVLDNSGSMQANDPEFLTRRAVSNFVDALADDDALDGRVAIVLFDGRARLAQPLTPATDIASTRRLDRTLASLDYQGQRTDSPAGIERALYELRERGRDEARKAIVFLTDGVIDTGDPRNDLAVARWLREDLASESADGDIRIFGIAFTDDADYQLMQALARRTRARYYRAFAPGELAPVVEDVLAKITAEPIYELAYVEEPVSVEAPTPAVGPDVAAAPLPQQPSEDGGAGLLGWLPVALLLAGAGLLVARGRADRPLLSALGAPRAPAAQLLDLGGQAGEAGRSLPLGPARSTIGRDPHNDVILEDDTISSEHAAIEVRDGRYWLEDLRSTNGTRLGNRRLADGERVPLKGGDHVRFADVDLMFVVEGYVPGGATVYLSSSTTPPADWSSLAHVEQAGPVQPSAQRGGENGRRASGEAEEGAAAARSRPAGPRTGTEREQEIARAEHEREIAFAERRERLDPAEVVDLDDTLAPERMPADGAERSADRARASQTAIERAEAALEAIEEQEHARGGPARPTLELITTPPRDEEAIEAVAPDSPPVAEPDRAPRPEPARESERTPEAEPARESERTPEAEPARASERTPEAEPARASDQTSDPERAGARERMPTSESQADEEATEIFATEPTAPGEHAPRASEPDDTAEVRVPDAARAASRTRDDEPTSPPDREAVRRAGMSLAPTVQPLAACLDYHLARVAEISPSFQQFIDRAFPDDLRQALPVTGLELIESARTSGRLSLRAYSRDRVRYVVCGVPGPMSGAREHFVEAHGGFTRVLTEQLQDEAFQRDRCEILALLTCGFDEQPWVSLSIVPDEGQDPRIDLLSYEFLTDGERREIEPRIDPEISQSGLA